MFIFHAIVSNYDQCLTNISNEITSIKTVQSTRKKKKNLNFRIRQVTKIILSIDYILLIHSPHEKVIRFNY